MIETENKNLLRIRLFTYGIEKMNYMLHIEMPSCLVSTTIQPNAIWPTRKWIPKIIASTI